MYDAMILAGGENNEYMQSCASERYEALIDIGGKPMVAFVAEALAASGRVRRILVLGPVPELAACALPDQVEIAAGGETILETICRGVELLGDERPVLIATADIPLLRAAAVQDFLQRCQREQADLYYPIIPQQLNARLYPGVKRTYVRLREGTFTGGNLFLVNPKVIPHCLAVANAMIENRKRPLRLAAILGWRFVFKFLFGRLRMAEVEQRTSELLGVRGAVIQSEYPELGLDVDKPSDLELVRGEISRA